MESFLPILLAVLLYALLCFVVALFRMLCSKSGQRKSTFGKTFWAFFSEALNPFHWFW